MLSLPNLLCACCPYQPTRLCTYTQVMTLIYTVLASCNPTVADLDLLVNSTHYRILREASNRSSHPIPIHPIASHPIASHPIPSHRIPSHPIPSHPIPSHLCTYVLRTTYYLE